MLLSLLVPKPTRGIRAGIHPTCSYFRHEEAQVSREVAQTNQSQAVLIRRRLGARGCGGRAGVQRDKGPSSPFPPMGPQPTPPSGTPDTPFLA